MIVGGARARRRALAGIAAAALAIGGAACSGETSLDESRFGEGKIRRPADVAGRQECLDRYKERLAEDPNAVNTCPPS